MKHLYLLATLLCHLTVATYAQQLPHVHILATGGTIAGVGYSSTTGVYKAGVLDIDTILSAVPELKDIAEVSSEQLFNIPSQDIDVADWLVLARRVNELLAQKEVDGVVITHGTDTMEKTAWFLQLTVRHNKPVVLTGSMRPVTSLGADGPLNIHDAVLVAGRQESVGQGVLIVMNGAILSARDATKTNTVSVQTFQSPNTGIRGEIHGQEVTYFTHPDSELPDAAPTFDVSALNELPKVGILYGYAGVGTEAARALIDAGYKGIVYAGVGNGNIHKNLLPVLAAAASTGVSVVRSSRTPSGSTTRHAEVDDSQYGFIASLQLNPQKARVLLLLALARNLQIEEIQRLFEKTL